MVLSKACIGEVQLRKASDYFQRKKKPPTISDAATQKAQRLLKQQLVATDSSSSMEFPSSFFDFEHQVDSKPGGSIITAHVIGRRMGEDNKPSAMNNLDTYHTEQWVVGEDVTEDDATSNVDSVTGCLYVWYRWTEGRWSRKLISRLQFQQLKSFEDGSM